MNYKKIVLVNKYLVNSVSITSIIIVLLPITVMGLISAVYANVVVTLILTGLLHNTRPVSYTHLDVYKRQTLEYTFEI